MYRFRLCVENRTFQFGYLRSASLGLVLIDLLLFRFYTSLLVARLDPDFSWESFVKDVFKTCPDVVGAGAKFKEEFDGLEKLKLELYAKRPPNVTWRDIIHKDIGLDLDDIKHCNCKALLQRLGVPPKELDAVCDLLNFDS